MAIFEALLKIVYHHLLTSTMTEKSTLLLLISIALCCTQLTWGYSAKEDARIIADYKRQLKFNPSELNHAQIARKLVHQANWASVGTISTNSMVKDYPMVNIISINDNDVDHKSTGRIRFLLTDLDFTGPDWQNNNKVTMLFTDEQTLHCMHSRPIIDPMEPTCQRVMISGQVIRMNKDDTSYDEALVSFVERHPAAKNWLKAHKFYLCELDIKNIFVLDYYGGPHNVATNDYYNVQL
ncbi:protein CREG1 isoform X1 [Stomoxys calcitrans]|uniref:protein CREG1 isoform X1 n=1 Tax=Stomoxys calcitrans TaxID=35570 RepID=UPI0027E38AB6|nr:protein CREG1 isoform X1 [Stomoxys calcitrans]